MFIFKLTIQVIILILAFSLVSQYSFNITFELKDYLYSFPSDYFFIVFITIIFAVYIGFNIYFRLKNNLIKFQNNNKIKKIENGYQAFSKSMIAISNKNFKKAVVESNKAEKLLSSKNSITLFLKSEIYKHQKKFSDLENVYEQMIKDHTLTPLGYKGMMELYLRNEDYHHALIYGEKLFQINPNIEKIYETLIQIIGKTKNWQQLINISKKAYKDKIIDKNIFNENTSIAYYEIAQIQKDNSYSDALKNIYKAIKLRENFSPYYLLLINLLIANNDISRAKKEVKKLWKNNPNNQLIKPSLDIASLISKSPLLTSYDLVGQNPQNHNAIELLISASIEEKKWSKARYYIKPLLSQKPSKKVCEFMATIEKEESNNIQISDSWKTRAEKGESENIWICAITKLPQINWTSMSKGGYFNSLQWKKPLMLNRYMETIN